MVQPFKGMLKLEGIKNRKEKRKMENYDDIIHLPHHVSKKHPKLSMQQRAAQFAPFAALTGYEDAINETVRLTESEMELRRKII